MVSTSWAVSALPHNYRLRRVGGERLPSTGCTAASRRQVEGACRAALRHGHLVRVVDAAEVADRWPVAVVRRRAERAFSQAHVGW